MKTLDLKKGNVYLFLLSQALNLPKGKKDALASIEEVQFGRKKGSELEIRRPGF